MLYKKVLSVLALCAFVFSQNAYAFTLYSHSAAAGTSVNSQGAIGGSDYDVFTFASFTPAQSGTIDNISWEGTSNTLSAYAGYSDGFTIDVLGSAIPLPGSVQYAPISHTTITGTAGLANGTPNANGFYDYNTLVQPFYVEAGKTYHLSIRANGIAPWGWATGPGTGTIAYVAGVFKFLPTPGIPVFALNNVNNTVVAPPLVNPGTVTIVPVPEPSPTTVLGALGEVQGMITSVGNGFITTTVGNGLTATYDGDTVVTYYGGLVTFAVGQMVNYSYTVDVDGVILAKTMDVYPTELVNGVGRISGYTTTNGVLNGNGLALSSGEVLTGTGVPFINFNYASSYNLIMSYSGYRNPATGFVYVTSATVSALPIMVKSVLPGATVGQMFSETALDFSLFGQPVNFGRMTASGLPQGLTVSGTQITGIPTVAGSYTVSLSLYGDAMLAGALLGKGTTTIVVHPSGVTPPVVATPVTFVSTLPNAQVAVAYTSTDLLATGVSPFSVTATGVPYGMTVSPLGVLSGTPQVAGTYTISLSGTSSEGATGQALVPLTVLAAPVIPIGTTLQSGVVGVSYPATSLAAPGISLYMVSNGSVTGVPLGMTVSASGILSGTPTVSGTYDIGFYAIGAGLRLLGTATSTITIATAPVVTPPPVTSCSGTNQVITSAANVRALILDIGGGPSLGGTAIQIAQNSTTIISPLTASTFFAAGNLISYVGTMSAANICVATSATISAPADTIAPLIVMSGTDVTMTSGTSYVDAGATCTDNVDVTCTVTTTSTVDTTTPGIYSVTYGATDAAGNVATPVVRTVTVSVPPVVTTTSAGIVTSVGRNFLVINGGLLAADHVFYTPTAAGTTFFGGVTVFATGEYVTFTGDVDAIGAVHATQMSVYPVVSFATTLSDGTESVPYTATNLVVSGTAPFSVSASGVPLGMTVDASGVLSGTPSTSGTYTIVISATDSMGNVGTGVVTLVIAPAPVVVIPDTTAPVITMNGGAVTLTAASLYSDLGATCTDNIDVTCTVTTVSTVNTAVPGNYTVTYSATDAAGNVATPVVRAVTVSVPPVVTPVIVSTGKSAEGNGKVTAFTQNTVTIGTTLVRITQTTVVRLNNNKPIAIGNSFEYKGVKNTDGSVTASTLKIQ